MKESIVTPIIPNIQKVKVSSVEECTNPTETENVLRSCRGAMKCVFGGDGHMDRGLFDYGNVNSIEEGRVRYKQFLNDDVWETIYCAFLREVDTGRHVHEFYPEDKTV